MTDAQGRPSTDQLLGAIKPAHPGEFRYGACPQQVTGRDKAGRPFYFRERHGEWTLHLGDASWPTDYVLWPTGGEIVAEGNGSPDPDFIDGLITLHLGEGWTHG